MKEFFRILSEMYEGVESDKIGEFKFCVSYSLTNTSFHYTIHGFGINDEPDFSNKAHELLGAKVYFNPSTKVVDITMQSNDEYETRIKELENEVLSLKKKLESKTTMIL